MREELANQVYTVQDYVDTRVGKKKAAYQRLLDKFDIGGYETTNMNLEFIMKKNEALFGGEERVKSRAIWNPSDAVKLYGGYVNWRLIKALKKILPEFCHGCSMSALEIKL